MTNGTDDIPRPTVEDAAYMRERRDSGAELEAAEKEQSAGKAVGEAGIPGLGAVRSLINATYFSDLLCHLAYKRFKHDAMEARVAAMITAHPKFAGWCRAADWIYRALAATVLLGTLTAVAVGTVYRVFFAV